LPTVNVNAYYVTAPTATSNCYGTITATTVNQPIYNVQGKGVIIGLTMMVTEILPAQQTVVISDNSSSSKYN
jgi:hypothetical protein